MTCNIQYSRFSDCSILIEWPAVIDDFMLEKILNFKNYIQNNYNKQNIEVINTYNSILVIYTLAIDNINDEILTFKALFSEQREAVKSESIIWEIPVCYDNEFGLDLEAFSSSKKLSKSEIIRRHSKPIYTVFFIGFLPGFLYLGGLDLGLSLDRKTTPSLNVKKGSVAIGGQQTGIYPQDSPGGWHCIGNSPVELFNSNKNPPCPIKAGDRVKFVSIKKAEHDDLLHLIKMSEYQLKSIYTNA
jgi:inhibitor of KinA